MSRKQARPPRQSGPSVKAVTMAEAVTDVAQTTVKIARTAATYARRQFEAAWNNGRPLAVRHPINITRVQERRTKVATQIVNVNSLKKTLGRASTRQMQIIDSLIVDALHYLEEIEYWLIKLHSLAFDVGRLRGNRLVMLEHKTLATDMFNTYRLKKTKMHTDKRNEIRRLVNALNKIK